MVNGLGLKEDASEAEVEKKLAELLGRISDTLGKDEKFLKFLKHLYYLLYNSKK